MKRPFYIGERIYLRAIEPEDGETVLGWVNDPEIWEPLGHVGPLNMVREKERIEGMYKDDREVVFLVMLKDGDRPVGTTGLHQIGGPARRATFGIMMGDVAQWNHGYGTEATRLTLRYGFEVLNLHRIELAVYAQNERARRVYEKAGFVEECVLRQRGFREGRHCDVLRMGILQREWRQQRAETDGEDGRAAAEGAAARAAPARRPS